MVNANAYRPRSLSPALLVGLAMWAVPPGAAAGQAAWPDLSLEEARSVTRSAIDEARRQDLRVVVAVVDRAGFLRHFERMDGAQLGSADVAIEKARAAALFRRPTAAFQSGVEGGALGLLGLSGAIPLEGGVPLETRAGDVIGAIGVSGATAAEDGVVAAAGAAALPIGGSSGASRSGARGGGGGGIRFLNPTTLPTPSGWTQLVEARGTRTLYISGQVPLDDDGALAGGDLESQVERVFANLQAALEAGGADFSRVVKLTYFVLDAETALPALREVRDRYVDTSNPPASTLIEIRRLASPDFQIEIEAVAVLP